MVEHTQETSHPITLSFSDVTVWCYGCDDYVHGDVSIIHLKSANNNLEQLSRLVYCCRYWTRREV